MTKIPDHSFPGIDQINSMPCYTADRYLRKVDESVTVTQICQDSNITSLVVIDFVLVGAFLFTPYCKLVQVDDDETVAGTNVPLAVGHYKNPDIPINTNCQTFHGQLVFDFGAVIPLFTTARYIKFELGMIGQVPQSFGVTFPNQTPTYIAEWNKGILPNPIQIQYINNSWNILFEYQGDRDCSCDIQCITPSGLTQNIQFCPDQKQLINIYKGDLTDDPTSYIVQLSDTFGNTSILNIQPVIGTTPRAPSTVLYNNPRRIEIGTSKTSINNVPYDEDVEYQILKYAVSSNNLIIWKDWSNRNISTFTDFDVRPGITYGYAIRFKGSFGDESELSDWTIVST